MTSQGIYLIQQISFRYDFKKKSQFLVELNAPGAPETIIFKKKQLSNANLVSGIN